MNEPRNGKRGDELVDCLYVCATLVTENEALREHLSWALGWVNARARLHHGTKYDAAVKATGQPDPQAWRDK